MDGNSTEDRNARGMKTILFLVANGALPATSTQDLYELAWDNGIKPLNELTLKKGYGRKRGRRGRSPGRCS